jgi:folate-binding Fe-S cluster repair protein YgfZ
LRGEKVSAVLVEDGPDKGAIWHFGEVAQEQRALAAGKAWADLSHRAVVSISGEDRLTWLHAITTQHLEKLQPGEWKEALVLDANGHVEQQFFLVDDGVTTFLHLDTTNLAALIKYLESMKFMLRVAVKDASNEFAVLRAPGKTDAIGGAYALLPRNELSENFGSFNF